MGILNVAKRVVKPFVDIPTWVGYKQLAATTRAFKEVIKELFIPAQAGHHEAFNEALARLGLTEADLQQRKKEFSRLRVVYVVIGACIFSYGVYLAWQGSVKGTIASFAITLIPLAQAFRYHFWLFQLRQRKLGCTFREWLAGSFAGHKK